MPDEPRLQRGPGVSRRSVLAGAVGMAAVSQLPGCAPRPEGRRPNVLLVLSDAQHAETLGCYGNIEVATPAADAMAREGLRLTAALSSTPQCRPYRAGLMSGDMAHHTGVLSNLFPRAKERAREKYPSRSFGVDSTGQWTPPSRPLLGEVFRDAGYRCGYIGKWDLGAPDVGVGPLRLGFDEHWMVWTRNTHDYYDYHHCRGPDVVVPGRGRFQPQVETREALGFIARESEAPWFLVVSWGPPHPPLLPPGEERRHVGMAQRPNVPTHGQVAERAAEQVPLYLELVEAIDHELGRLLAAVDDDTLVVFTSDHGSMMGSQGTFGKELPYRESLGVPFVARWPGRLAAGRVLDEPLGTPDVFPTLAGLAGLPVPAGRDGADLSAWLRGEAPTSGRDGVLVGAPEARSIGWPGWRGVRTARHLYARTESGPWLLFDHAEDPFEQRDLVAAEPGLVDDLDGLLRELMARHGDGWRVLDAR